MTKSPYEITNIRMFIAFRVFFNSRFYYPVFTILFLDYGLTLEQFALLNTVWAVTIVLTEVPSGALADLMGRKRLLVLTSLLMIVELSVICFVPIANITLVFWAFLINRILSGLAEAMASGADEAIAYDSLLAEGNKEDWPNVLSVQMRLKSLAGIISMALGALLYDPNMVNRMIGFLGGEAIYTQQITMRIPVYLTLGLGFFSLYTTLRMKDVADESQYQKPEISLSTMIDAGRVTLNAGKWILATPFALAVILFAMLYDHVLRMIITLTSQYFRQIALPEASFGFIMAALSLLGLAIPKLAEFMVNRYTPVQNCLWLALITMCALAGLTGFVPYFGIIPIALVMVGLMLTAFFTSHYLNAITSSAQRATVLSFKGLAFNLAYGLVGVLFAILMQYQRNAVVQNQPNLTEQLIENEAFRSTIFWSPWYGAILTILLIGYTMKLLAGSDMHRTIQK
ncbi:MAG: MFS transporter [Desulfobulbaceae bacterium]|nr:MAG: MFS transporter [Desulfobulbaceae bacterium]